MTGEMHAISQDGIDSNGEEWPIHAAIAKAVGGTLQPFDQYQGPYISIGADLRVGNAPYSMPVQHLGIKRLWLTVTEDGIPTVYREDTDTQAECCWDDTESAIAAAQSLLV